jgi:hypothetical protein
MKGLSMPLYVESPQACYPPAVLEGSPQEGDETGIVVAAPEAFRRNWPTVSTHHFVHVSDGAGPARMLATREELTEVLQQNPLS